MKGVFGLLNEKFDWEDKRNIEVIKATAHVVFGKNYVLGEIKISDRPFTEFEWPMRIYDQFDVMLNYDRSILGINLNVDGQFLGLSRLTSKPVFRGFDAVKSENLLHNFKVLDEELKLRLGKN